jgi:hypothetical protein
MAALMLIAMLTVQGTPALQASSARFTVDVLDRGSDESGARLMITRKDTTRYHITSLNRALGRVKSVRLRSDDGRVIVATERGFAVVDPVGRAPQDEVYGYDATPSKDGHWVGYLRALRDQQNAAAGEGILMYDTTGMPDQNRAAFPIAAERSSAAGRPVYPPAGEWKQSTAMQSADRRPPEQWWLERVYVAALHEAEGDRLVVADLSQPEMRACSKVLPEQKDRWSQASVSVRQQNGSYVVEISSPARDRTETITFPADCR